MDTIAYDPEKHFSEPDRQRLAQLAAAHGQTVGDYIEFTVKRQMFSTPPLASARRRSRKPAPVKP